MVKVITINNLKDVDYAVRTLDRASKRLPRLTIDACRKWGNGLAKDIKLSAKKAKINSFTGQLFGNGIRWEQGKRSQTGYLFMRLHGIYLDSMEPHYVNVTRKRTRLLAWAKKSRKFSRKARLMEKGKLNYFSIYVKPHPFIYRGYMTSRPKLRPLLKQASSRAINI